MSRTWLLVNSAGNPNFSVGDMDIVWENGAPKELTLSSAILDQRIRKTSITRKNSNRYAPNLGFITNEIGAKNTGDARVKSVGASVSDMMKAMIASQREVSGRIELDLEEQIDKVTHLTVISDGSRVSVEISMTTKAGGEVSTQTPDLSLRGM